MHRTRDNNIFIGQKIFSIRKCSVPSFSFVQFPCYVSRAFLIIKTSRFNLKYLLCILNSKTIGFWLFNKGKLQGNLYQVDKTPLLSIPIMISTNKYQIFFIIIADYLTYIKKIIFCENINILILYFEQVIDGMVFELYFEDEVKKAGRDILKYLTNLTPITDDMSDEEKMQIITKTFNELYDKNHSVRQNLEGMDEIKEIRIIKGLA